MYVKAIIEQSMRTGETLIRTSFRNVKVLKTGNVAADEGAGRASEDPFREGGL